MVCISLPKEEGFWALAKQRKPLILFHPLSYIKDEADLEFSP